MSAMVKLSSQLCECGCGEVVSLARRTDRRSGHIKGRPVRFLYGHQQRSRWLSDVEYVIEDRGYKTPCWIWQRGTDKDGYGQVRVDGVQQKAHRVYYERQVGPIPPGYVIDHLCKITPCVNPEHHEPVTGTENKRRGKATKLSLEDLEKIRQLRGMGLFQREIAAIFGVDRAHISYVCSGKVGVSA